MADLNHRNAFFDRLIATPDLIWMGQNTTHIEPPAEVLQAIDDSITRREFQIYAPPLGFEELRELIRADLALPDSEVIVTDGAVSGLYHICKTLGPQISQLITTDPGWPWPQQFVESLGIPTKIIDVYRPEGGYKLQAKALASVLTHQALIYLIDPLNPLGSSYTADELIEICDLARRAQAVLIHDCTYRHFAHQPSLAASYYPEGTLTTYSFSKWLGLAGFRIGAIVTSSKMFNKLGVALPNSLGANIVAQRAAIAGLKVRASWVKQIRAINKVNQSLLNQAVSESKIGSTIVYPSNGNFMAVELANGRWTSESIAFELLREKLFIRSGTYQSKMSGQRFIKISTAVPREWAERLADKIRVMGSLNYEPADAHRSI
jgi:aspartate/methionine/tyrosine aminotransferase